MPNDPKQRDRERTTSSSPKSIAEREREETSFVGPGERARVTGSRPAQERERVTQKTLLPSLDRLRTSTGTVPKVATATGAAPAPPKQMTGHQKQMLSSGFQDAARLNALKAAVGGTTTGERRLELDDDDDEATSLGKTFDGKTPSPELTSRDLFKAVQAPVQSREGRRNKNLFQQVLYQFAVGNNPRYEPDGPGKPRGHIYIWDVSRAMNCEVPHFVGMKELSLSQTVDWLRHEGPARAWIRATPEDALALAARGQLVIAMPKEVRLKHMGVVVPEPADKEGRPKVAGAGVKVGASLTVYELFGVYAAEYFTHA